VKLFQIEEPDGSPNDPGIPGAAIGIDAASGLAEVAAAVGGNAVVLADREGFERILPVPDLGASAADWCALFEGARLRAERALARPVSHAVIVLAAAAGDGTGESLRRGAEQAGVAVLRVVGVVDLPAADRPVLGAAILAEDLMPPPGTLSAPPAY
jgi:hypothetical protein